MSCLVDADAGTTQGAKEERARTASIYAGYLSLAVDSVLPLERDVHEGWQTAGRQVHQLFQSFHGHFHRHLRQFWTKGQKKKTHVNSGSKLEKNIQTINTYMNQVSQVFSSEKNKNESNYGSHYWMFVEVFYLSLRLHILGKHSTDPPSTHPTALPLPISFAVSHLPFSPPPPDS